MKQVQINRDTALKLARDVIATLDQEPLCPYVDAMMTEGYKQAIAVSAISGNNLDNFALFLAMCEDEGVLSENETNHMCLQLVQKSKLESQVSVQGKLDPGRGQDELDKLEKLEILV